jgi:sodium/potassium/calcium exchanger 6
MLDNTTNLHLLVVLNLLLAPHPPSLLVTIFGPVPTHSDPKVVPPIWIAVPLALYGFVIAATWIDFIADQLVEVLQYFGVIAHIPNAILGLTILAWGNSIGDLSCNLSMAKRGLANMSITACFAGPVFNMLVGLGVGFNLSRKQQGLEVLEIEYPPSVWVGLIFLVVNCITMLVTGLVFEDGFVPAKYGFIGLSLNVVYVITCISLEFGQ